MATKEAFLYRKLALEDIPRLIELRQLQLQEEGAVATFDLAPFLQEYYQKHWNEGSFISWLALDKNTIIATSGLSITEKPPYYGNPSGKIGLLSSMYTLPHYRRRGIAKQLLVRILHEAKEQGCGAVHVTASDAGVPLYQDFGFCKSERFFFYALHTPQETE